MRREEDLFVLPLKRQTFGQIRSNHLILHTAANWASTHSMICSIWRISIFSASSSEMCARSPNVGSGRGIPIKRWIQTKTSLRSAHNVANVGSNEKLFIKRKVRF